MIILCLVLRVVPSRSVHSLFGLASEVGEHGARIMEVLEAVADVLHFLFQKLTAF